MKRIFIFIAKRPEARVFKGLQGVGFISAGNAPIVLAIGESACQIEQNLELLP